MLTGVCSFRCPFCFGPAPASRTLDADKWLAILAFLGHHEVRVLLVSGGEPLLYPRAGELLFLAHSQGFRISLATSCPTTKRVIDTIESIDWLELSLHGSSPVLHAAAGRTRENFNDVLDVLSVVKPMPQLKVKVNTVVTPSNAADLPNLARLLAEYRVETWKLLEVRPRGSALLHRDAVTYEFDPHRAELEAVVDLASTLMRDTRVVVSSANAGDKSYFVIDPDGRVLIPDGDRYIDVGDLSDVGTWTTDDADSFCSRVVATVDSSNNIREFETGFEALS
jgi:MoaA/NifB/PqqE/SkfB family radical SAM enzyme